jgi:uncharacterized damage-inducible protein DinB
MFRRIEDFLASHATLTKSTRRLLAGLDDDCLDQNVAAGHRSLGQLAWHIVTSVPEMSHRTGLEVGEVDPAVPPPCTAAEIRDGYDRVHASLRLAVSTAWGDDSLLEIDEMYGEAWPRGLTLMILVQHEIHHRGQMTVLLRQSGRPVVGLMGPAKEEWAQMGLPPPAF